LGHIKYIKLTKLALPVHSCEEVFRRIVFIFIVDLLNKLW